MQDFPGFFSDGHTAEKRPVTVRLGASALGLRGPKGEALADWPYRELRLVEEVYAGQPVRLRAKSGGDARLVVREPHFLDALGRHAPQLRTANLQRSRALPRALAWGAATLATLVGLYFGLPLLAEPVAGLMPLAWEERMGQNVRGQVLALLARNAKECAAPQGRAALEGLVKRLAGTVESRYTFRVMVVDSPVVNAFAAPGGYIVVFRGLVDKASSGEEVAGVLAHEMGHVIERHGTEALIRQLGMNAVLGAMLGDASGIGSTAADIGSQLAVLSYGRAAEREADRVGVSMLNRADIRGAGLVAFFQRVGKESGGDDRGVLRYLGTHPPTGERAADIEARAIGKGDAMSAAEWQALRTVCTIKR
ncbi:MAG TPA: M48 family metallopeptidase [Alphaproteobacteria bacterium]|jgi:predicted Zn-dependent protease